MCTQSEAISILGEVYHSCSSLLRNTVKDAYLYGSYARGDFHAESDIDILLTVDLDANDLSSLRNAIATVASELSLKHDITVSLVVKPYAQFVRYHNVLPFYKNVLQEGIRYAS